MSAWIHVAMQVMMSPPNTRIWSSTFSYPVELLHHTNIYIGGILFQAFSNFSLVIVDVAVDTYGASLLHVLGGHLNILGKQLRNLGQNNMRNPEIERKTEMIEICEKYVSIIELSRLRYGIILNAI